MAITYHKLVIVSSSKEAELKPLPGKRTYLLLENRSVGPIYLNYDTHADSVNGIEIAAGGHYELEDSPPQNDIYLIGSQVSDQRINVTESYDRRPL